MKIKPLILIGLLALEVFMPCASATACSAHSPQEEEKVCLHHDVDAENEDHSENEDHCPDGCRCYCCTVVLMAKVPGFTYQNEAPAHPEISSIVLSYHFDFAYSIWQPPKLAA